MTKSTHPTPLDKEKFDEVVDSGPMVRFEMDGNQWCAKRLPFTNMMEMPVGFGDTPMQALAELIRAESHEQILKVMSERDEYLRGNEFASRQLDSALAQLKPIHEAILSERKLPPMSGTNSAGRDPQQASATSTNA